MSVLREVVVPRESEPSVDIVEASRVTITPIEVRIEPKASASVETLTVYRRNVWLFLLFVVLASAWFYRHFETYFSQGLVVGLPLTYAVWQVGFSYWKSFWEKNAEDLRRRWLSQRATTLQLIGLCVGAALFLATTSSVWVSLSAGNIDRAIVEVRAQNRLIDRVEISEVSRIGGRLYFPRFLPRRFDVVVITPNRWQIKPPHTRTSYPWSAFDLKFPEHFEKRPVRALRIVPGVSLREDIGLDGSDYTLAIQDGARSMKVLPRYRFATVYVGVADPGELRAIHMANNTPGWSASLEQTLIADGAKPEGAKKYASLWVSRTMIGFTRDFDDRQRITVTLGIPGQPPIAKVTTEPLGAEMTTLLLEKQ